MQKTIYYVYPQHHDVSFKFVAKEHIKMLKEKYTVYEIPALSFYQFTPFRYPDFYNSPVLLFNVALDKSRIFFL